MIRIAILSDVHLGKSAETKHHPKLIRQANDQALSTLKATLPQINSYHPDLLVHMGDIIRNDENSAVDEENLHQGLVVLAQSPYPAIHLLGNYELKLSKQALNKIYQTHFPQTNFYGSQLQNQFQILWLDMNIQPDKRAVLLDERLTWLDKTLTFQTPSIIFSHYSLIPINQQGSFYFQHGPEHMHYQNYQDILEVIKGRNVKACVNAHVHLLTHQEIDGIHFISNPAFSENIAGMDFPTNNPGIYSIFEIDPEHMVYTSYSQQFAFAKIQATFNIK